MRRRKKKNTIPTTKRAAHKPAEGEPVAEDTDPEAVEPELEGWSPLVIGARAFASGLGAVA